MKKLYALFTLVMVGFSIANASPHKHPERYYQTKWCNDHKGTMEVPLPDGTRVDCVTDTHAVEFDFSNKWAESVGQALHYAVVTEKTAGIVLIGDNQEVVQYIKYIAEHYNIKIDVWSME